MKLFTSWINTTANNDIPRDKSRCNAPPDWLKTTMARIVPSLQLAQTEPLLHLTPYSYTFQSSIENFFAYAILRAALFSAASPAERLRSAGSLAIIIIGFTIVAVFIISRKKTCFGERYNSPLIITDPLHKLRLN